MKNARLIIFVLLNAIAALTIFAAPGFYKDLFMDGGLYLSSRTTLPAADTLGLDWEFLATDSSLIQSEFIITSPNDQNGALLYPDGSPRFKAFYSNGGSATNHGNSLGEEGRNRVRSFFYNGGSYTGSCAGAFIASISYLTSGFREAYYRIWPGRTASTGLSDSHTGHFIEPASPLLDYFDFGGDSYIANVYHNGGCYAREDIDFPPETEILLRYDRSGYTMHNKPSCWAYKASDSTGRIVVIGSHPEGIVSGERLELMEAIYLYALDGVGMPKIKASLENSITRTMDKYTSDSLPAFTRIGDKQYHHFIVNLPEHTDYLTVNLSGESGYDFNLYINNSDIAFESTSVYSDISPGATKSINIRSPGEGEWFIGIECASTVTTTLTSWGYEYSGDIAVLDGLSYSISASWDTISTEIVESERPVAIFIGKNYPNPFNTETKIEINLDKKCSVTAEIYSINGKLIRKLHRGYLPQGKSVLTWSGKNQANKPVSSGLYLFRISNGKETLTREIILMK
ncbi:T9SS type A sorting domain-containing protein [bacterium]|nr:T9SS type A sorting domain-containing protein [bacterium]